MVSHFVVSPIERIRAQWVNVAVVIRSGHEGTIPGGVSLRRVEFENVDLFDDSLPEGIRVVFGVVSPQEIPVLQEIRSARRDLNLWAHPLAEHRAVAEAAGKAGIPVVFSDQDAGLLGTDLGLDLLSFYLFEPDLAVPIEPFHSLLRAELGEDRSLWNIWFGRPEEHFYVANDGRVSLSLSWARRDQRMYGLDSSGPEAWVASPGYRELRELLSGRNLPAQCRTCPARRRCQGAVVSLLDDVNCDKWPEVLTRIHLAALSIKPSRRKGGGLDGPG